MEEEKMETLRVLRLLREAQNNICAVCFDLDDCAALEQALTLIGNTMDGISKAYDLPIMSEQ